MCVCVSVCICMSTVTGVCLQVRLLHDGKERGRMYAGYALSSIISPSSGMTEIRAAGVIPALVSVLDTSKVTSLLCYCVHPSATYAYCSWLMLCIVAAN